MNRGCNIGLKVRDRVVDCYLDRWCYIVVKVGLGSWDGIRLNVMIGSSDCWSGIVNVMASLSDGIFDAGLDVRRNLFLKVLD